MKSRGQAVPAPFLWVWFLALVASLLLVGGCHTPPPASARLQRFEFSSPHMGTLFTITLYAPDHTAAETAARQAFRRVADLEDVMSDYQADSELMRLCDQPYGRPVPVSADLFDVLQTSLRMSEASDGAFDVTVGPYVRLWRFARKKKVLPTAAEVSAARAAVGWQKLKLDRRARTVTLLAPNMRLDLGGIGKGYAADQALRVLNRCGIQRAIVAASGDIAVGEPPPGQPGWKIGITTLDAPAGQVSRTVTLRNAGISTSGDSEQFVEINGVRYSHIVSPLTGLGLTNRIQATVIGPNATTTDSLDTTISVLGVGRGLALADALPGTAVLLTTEQAGQVERFASRRFKPFQAKPEQTK